MRSLFQWIARDKMAAKVRAMVPTWVKHVAKLVLRPAYRSRMAEWNRLRKMPANTPAQTTLLGLPFELVDVPSFLFCYQEIFEKEMYRFHTVQETPLIIDGGSNVGVTVAYFKKLFPKCRVLAFEPDPIIFPVLERNCRSLGLENVELIPKALWSSDSLLAFKQDGADAGRVIENTQDEPVIGVSTCRLRGYLQTHISLLKLDIEGAETEVLSDCRDLLKNVENIIVEYHSFSGQEQTLDILLGVLKHAGFRIQVHTISPAPHPLVTRNLFKGMDLQLNIFGFR